MWASPWSPGAGKHLDARGPSFYRGFYGAASKWSWRPALMTCAPRPARWRPAISPLIHLGVGDPLHVTYTLGMRHEVHRCHNHGPTPRGALGRGCDNVHRDLIVDCLFSSVLDRIARRFRERITCGCNSRVLSRIGLYILDDIEFHLV